MMAFPDTEDATVIVTDAGFSSDHRSSPFLPATEIAANKGCATLAVDVAPDTDLDLLKDDLDRIAMIRVAFPTMFDGRGLTIARQLRQMGYTGHLRAAGHVIADQYAMVRRVGFDDVEIPADLAARQPEPQWRERFAWKAHDYQSRLRG